METVRASNLTGRTRAAAWSDTFSSMVEKADWTAANPDGFDAQMCVADLGPVRVARLTCSASTIQRSARHIGHGAGRAFSCILQSRGSGLMEHHGHQTVLQAGDFILCDSSAPHAYRLSDGAEVVILRTPAKVLRDHLPSPEFFCGRRLAAAEGLTGTAAALTLSVCAQLAAGLSREFQDRVARHLLGVIATSYAMAFDAQMTASSNMNGRYARVKLFIEEHLRDPELSPCTIAAALKLSPRYLRMIFASSNETISAYILRRRLEECARQMADPSWSGHSITEIAFAWGFNSAPHFTRSFREHFELSPREYRRERLENRRAPHAWTPPARAPALAEAAA